jgi:hypothetical protein
VSRGEGEALLQNAGISDALPSGRDDPGLLICADGLQKNTVAKFAAAIAKSLAF